MAIKTPIVVIIFFIYNTYSDTITCDGGIKYQDCRGKTISCTTNDSCTIRCQLDLVNATEYGVCVNSVLNCKNGQHCLIRCDSGIGGCSNSIINAHTATKLDIISENNNSFDGSQIFCPLNNNCNFIANPTDVDKAFYGMTILSQTGFANNLIDIRCDKFNCLENARINCTFDYSQSCLIDNDPFKQDRCITGADCGMSLSPTVQPTMDPTANPSAPTLEPTTRPVTPARTLQCDAWEITISFMLLRYEKTDKNWKQKLKTLCLNAFIETIMLEINTWSIWYCCIVAEMIAVIENVILNDVSVDVSFIMNNDLFLDTFRIHRNMTQFGVKFKNYLLNELVNDLQDINELTVEQPVYIYPLQIKGNHDDRHNIILTGSIMIIVLCCILSIYTCHRCWQYEKTVDESDYDVRSSDVDGTAATAEYIGDKKPEISNLKRLSYRLAPIKLKFNNIPSVRTSKVTFQIEKELEKELEMAQMTHSPSNSRGKHMKYNKSHTQTKTLSETESGLMKMNTAQQELELNKIFEEMMQDTTEKDPDSESSNKSTKM